MKRMGSRTKQMSGLMMVVALLASGLVPPGGAQEQKVKEATARNKDFEAESHLPDPPGKIAFASDRDGNFEIYVMNADGGGLTRLTDNPAEDTQPTWSPDGTRLAFVSNRDGNKEIYVMSAEGGGVTRLTTNTAEDIEPAWSPLLTNQKIAFVSHRDGNDEIYVMNVDGTGQTNLTQTMPDDTGPAWAPSGTLLGFASNRDGDKFEIYRMNSDGTNLVRLTNNSFTDVSPAWPPGRITFQSDRDGNDELYTMNAGDGTNQTRLTNSPAFDLDPARSSDGARLVWVSNRDDAINLEIYAANADGSNVVRLTNNAASDVDPALQPLPSATTLGTIQLSASTFSVGEGQGSVGIIVTRTGGTGAARVDIETISGSASERTDFAPIFRTLTFAAGETSKTINVAIIDDAYNEGDETFNVTLGNATGAVLGAPSSATVTIGDNETSSAVTLYGVTAANSLVRFSSATPGTIDTTVAITGLQAAETVVGIDVRPATLQLYLLGSTSRLYTLDPGTGAATLVGTAAFTPALSGTSFGFDFNPAVDRIRVVSDAEQNLRLHPDLGTVVDGDAATAGIQPDPNLNPAGNVVAVAYTNNVAGTATTTLFGIDSASDMLVRIGGANGTPSPNLGVITNIGALGVDTTEVVGFDITNPGGTAYATLRVGGNSQLYTINLTTGAATLVGNVGGTSALTGLTAVNPAANPIDEARFFVRQQYLDFLNREPDPGGLAFWTNEITKCGADATCINRRRVEVSAAFFVESEFQETGGFLIRTYLAALNRRITYNEFLRDQSRLADLGGSKQAFLEEFVQRPEFVALHGARNNAQYVDALNTNSGNSLTTAERNALVAGLNNGTESRASVLRQVADNAAFRTRQFNEAFVLMQYIGYLRRDPDPGGFAFWLNILNTTGNFRAMVCAFITSAEYQARFGSVRTRTDTVCSAVGP